MQLRQVGLAERDDLQAQHLNFQLLLIQNTYLKSLAIA